MFASFNKSSSAADPEFVSSDSLNTHGAWHWSCVSLWVSSEFLSFLSPYKLPWGVNKCVNLRLGPGKGLASRRWCIPDRISEIEFEFCATVLVLQFWCLYCLLYGIVTVKQCPVNPLFFHTANFQIHEQPYSRCSSSGKFLVDHIYWNAQCRCALFVAKTDGINGGSGVMD